MSNYTYDPNLYSKELMQELRKIEKQIAHRVIIIRKGPKKDPRNSLPLDVTVPTDTK